MDNFKSYEFTFLYLINKCILLFKYIDNTYQKEILYDIKNFINKLEEIFQNILIKNSIEKKNKIFEILIEYFQKIIHNKIYNLIIHKDKEYIIMEVEKKALSMCNNTEKKVTNDIANDKSKKIINSILIEDTQNYTSKDLNDLEKKINNKIKLIFVEIENNIKSTLKDYFLHTECVEYDLDKKFNNKIYDNNILIENKIKDLIEDLFKTNLLKDTICSNDEIYNYINNLINKEITDIYPYLDSLIKNNIIIDNQLVDLQKKTDSSLIDINNKITLLEDVFNDSIQQLFNGINTKMVNNDNELISFINSKFNKNELNKNNFNIIFDKEQNEIQLYYFNELISSCKINIKGLIGPKGPQGIKGDNGEKSIIRKISFTDNNKLKFLIQESSNIYEIITEDSIPLGPPGIQGLRGEPGKSLIGLKWNQDDVMLIDQDNKDSLIFLKSLCIGEKSHCLKDNSLSIGGGVCYQNNSVAIGHNSKTLDSDSIALFGTCIGKKSFSYRADNIDENTIQFGNKEKTNYNINSFNIVSKEINLECDSFKIKTNKYENNKIKELEEKIIFLEKKITEILKKI
jgi:hypothetical protein